MGRRLLWITLAIVAVAAIAAVSYHLGTNGVQNDGPFMNRRGFGMMGWGNSGWGLLPGLILVFVAIFLFVALITGIDRPATYRTPGPTTTAVAPAIDDVARLRELIDLHDRGGLTDEEFSAAKKKILGL